MSSSGVDLEKYRIPLDKIMRATNGFSSNTMIGDGGFGIVYLGQLSEEWQKRTVAIKRLNRDGYQGNNEFRNELEVISSLNHPNVITFVGYCDDANEMIIVYEYAAQKSLDRHLYDPEKRRCITWVQRLEICVGAARGLRYLHSGMGKHRVIHRDVKSANVLLNDNMDAKICDFGLSKFGATNQEQTQLLTNAAGTRFYMDPIYAERGRLSKDSDIYSFGVVMFEISSGTLVYHKKSFGGDKPQYLINLVRSYYEDDEKAAGRLEKLIDPFIRDHIYMKSVDMFNRIAHACLNLKSKQRPTMSRIIRRIEEALDIQLRHEASSTMTTRSLTDLKIPLNEIKLATLDFSPENCIVEEVVFGAVYRGQLIERWQNRTITIKRLDPDSYRGEPDDFYKEFMVESGFQHKNIIRLIGYSDEADEKIIVCEYALNGSVADHLRDSDKRRCLTWAQRLQICYGAAKAIQFIQSHVEKHMVVMTHGNVNTQNILLDENLEAKTCFLNLTEQSMKHSMTYTDAFAFRVILCEMLTGTVCTKMMEKIDGYYPRPEEKDLFQQFYFEDGHSLSIDPFIIDEIDSRSLETFKKTAYHCLKEYSHYPGSFYFGNDPEAFRWIDTVVERIEDAMDFQEVFLF